MDFSTLMRKSEGKVRSNFTGEAVKTTDMTDQQKCQLTLNLNSQLTTITAPILSCNPVMCFKDITRCQ